MVFSVGLSSKWEHGGKPVPHSLLRDCSMCESVRKKVNMVTLHIGGII